MFGWVGNIVLSGSSLSNPVFLMLIHRKFVRALISTLGECISPYKSSRISRFAHLRLSIRRLEGQGGCGDHFDYPICTRNICESIGARNSPIDHDPLLVNER